MQLYDRAYNYVRGRQQLRMVYMEDAQPLLDEGWLVSGVDNGWIYLTKREGSHLVVLVLVLGLLFIIRWAIITVFVFFGMGGGK
jgi:hypothetical protein